MARSGQLRSGIPTMAAENSYDVFLSHSSEDKAIVRKLAQRLKDDGLSVWFDEWVIKPGEMIGKKIDEGLESSRVLLLCMSKHYFASEWSSMESGSFRFRDPTNKEGRFIPLRLDKTELPFALRQFAYVEWGRKPDDSVYQRLLESIRPPQAEPRNARRSSSIAQSDRSHPLPWPYGRRAQRGLQSRWPPRGVGVMMTRRYGCGTSPAAAARPPCRATPPRFRACPGAGMAAGWCRGLRTRRYGCGRSPAAAARPPCRATPTRFGACRGAGMAAAWCRGLMTRRYGCGRSPAAAARPPCRATPPRYTERVVERRWPPRGVGVF